MLNILFLGSHEVPTPILNQLHKSKKFNLKGLVTTPYPKNNKEDVYNHAKKVGLEAFQPSNFNSSSKQILQKTKPDMILVCSYGQILDKSTLTYPKYGCLNIHFSLLPKLRGACPIERAILDGLEVSGITIQLMEKGLDEGDIVFQKSLDLAENETKLSLTKRLQDLTNQYIEKVLIAWSKGKIEPKKQNNNNATYCTREDVSKQAARIDWSQSIETIHRKIRAFFPDPSAWSRVELGNNEKRIKIMKATIVSQKHENEIGTVKAEDDKIGIWAKNGLIYPTFVQLEGKKKMPVDVFLRGIKDKLKFI